MVSYDPIDAFRAFSQKGTAMPSFAAATRLLPERPWDLESIFRQEIVVSVTKPTKIFVFFAKSLGISITFCYVMVKTPLKPFSLEDLSCRLSVGSSEEQRVLQKIKQVLPQERLTALGRQTGAIKRMRKINPVSLLGALCLLAFHGSCSLRLVAAFTGILGNCKLSKQALAQRINESWVRLFSSILSGIVARTALPVAKAPGLFSSFTRVLVQDSTTLALPQKLASFFPGSGNQVKKKNAMIRLQAVVDLLSESSYISISPPSPPMTSVPPPISLGSFLPATSLFVILAISFPCISESSSVNSHTSLVVTSTEPIFFIPTGTKSTCSLS
jgi:hypothetical protein